MTRSSRGIASGAGGSRRRFGWVLGCLWVISAAGWVGGEAAAAGPRLGSSFTTWAPADGDYRFGLMPFSAPQEARVWSLGAARGLGVGAKAGAGSYFGAGLSLARPPGPEFGGLPDDMEVGAWVGGCVSCSLGAGATLDLELRWAPDSLSLGGDPFDGEPRSGLMLRVPW